MDSYQNENKKRLDSVFITEAASYRKDSSRKDNEDSALADTRKETIAVFDGMGGPGSGDVASQAAVASLQKELLSRPSKDETALRAWLETATSNIDKAVKQATAKNKRAGTTGTIATISGYKALVVNAGDSRCYLFNRNTLDFRLVTKDDGLTNNPEVQMIVDSANSVEDLTSKESVYAFQERNYLTLCFGHIYEHDPAALTEFELAPGDLLLISSDGLHDNLTYQEIVKVLIKEKDSSLKTIAEKLLKATKDRIKEESFRSKDDDISIALLGINS